MLREQKIAVIDRALELLGKNGENWAQGYYFAQHTGEVTYKKADPKEAEMWCVAGACNQAAYELGIFRIRRPIVADDVTDELSLTTYARQQRRMELTQFNDSPATSFRAVRELLNGYLEQLKGEQE